MSGEDGGWGKTGKIGTEFFKLLKHWLCDVQLDIVYCGEELGRFCWPVPAAGIAAFSASHRFAEHTSQM